MERRTRVLLVADAITLAHLDGGPLDMIEGNRQIEVRIFTDSGEPRFFLRHGAILCAGVRCFPTLRSGAILLAWPAQGRKSDRRQA